MLNIQKLSKKFEDKIVLDEINLSVNTGDVVALVGANGAGKTTLLKIISGLEAADSGSIKVSPNTGYVPQKISESSQSVSEFFDDVEKWKIDCALAVVGLENIGLERKIKSLSGGQKTKLSISKLFTKDNPPDLLLLDEPTNNLDAEAIEWLKKFILSFNGGVLLVSHDRSFINEVANKTIEINDGKLKTYGGNYDFYKEQKAIELQTEFDEYEKYNSKRNKLRKNLHIFKSQIRGVSNKSFDKVKHESKQFFHTGKDASETKLGEKIKAVKSKIDQLEEVKKPKLDKKYNLSLAGEVHKYKKIFIGHSIKKSFSNKLILNNLDVEITGNERIEISGANGVGKSTLLKIIGKKIKADSGDLSWGENIKIGYYAQDTELLNLELSGFNNLNNQFVTDLEIFHQARLLGLRAEDVKKPAKELSRGQQAKLAFCKLLLQQNELLVLDEPTNHLDIVSKEQLEAALNYYKGALVVTSHDRYFIDQINIVTKIVLK
jgi:ATPase subunit of ABC transporter with duplicated ATPase domains